MNTNAASAVSPTRPERLRVLVLFGGRSGEHPISCATAAGVLAAIDPNRYHVIAVGISEDGVWHRVSADPEQYRLGEDEGARIPTGGIALTLIAGTGEGIELTPAGIANLGRIDVVFPLLHGPFGEDGTVQGFLEMAGLRYVGCGVLSSAACMDKHTTKVLLTGHGLPAGRWALVDQYRWRHDPATVLDELAPLGLPVFVKPCRAGSSLGITRVERAEELAAAIDEARQHDPRVIVEAATPGREVECAVLGGRAGERPRVAGPGEIIVAKEDKFYDYETKYFQPEQVELAIPAELSEQVAGRARQLAASAFEALACEGLARVDLFYDEETDRLVINEVNTMPGFTPFSMYPKLWESAGLAYSQLAEELIELAWERPLGLR